jgi:DNA repair protein RadC
VVISEEIAMKFSTKTNLELLECAIGKEAAARIYGGTLASLFAGQGTPDGDRERLHAVRELVARWLEEGLHHAPPLSSSEQAEEYLRVRFAGQENESFIALFVDSQCRLIAAEELFRGTLTEITVYPREVVKRALQLNAAAVIFAHNHPRATAEPSEDDLRLTKHLKKALALVDVDVLDHLVVAEGGTMSFADREFL